MPTFSHRTIRRFHKNASAMKRLAVRDFEDLLQVKFFFQSLGLLPAPHNEVFMDLLFHLVTWHPFGKLRMHMDNTHLFFDVATSHLSHSVHKFQARMCSSYQTMELPQESTSRARRCIALIAKDPQAVGGIVSNDVKMKRLNLITYKYHMLGDYPETIQEYGTTDSYSIQMVRPFSSMVLKLQILLHTS